MVPFIDPLVGVLRETGRVAVPGAPDFHVYTASHASGASSGSISAVADSVRDPSGGKGPSEMAAEVSALAEGIERVSAIYRNTSMGLEARASQLPRSPVLPCHWQHFSTAQYATRGRWNGSLPNSFQWVPEPYRDEVIEWTPLRSLISGEIRYAPSSLVFLGYTGDGRGFGRADSNGLASGNCIEEAILHAFFELVERDAVSLWWYNRIRRPGVRLLEHADAFVTTSVRRHAHLGRTVWALDLRHDLGIPCYVALSARTGPKPDEIAMGFGAHLDDRVALRRAVAELNQLSATVCRSSAERRSQLLPRHADALRWWDEECLADHPYLCPDPGEAGGMPPNSRPESDDLRDHISICLERAVSAGLDVLVHDLTQPDIGFPAVRVVVPGLRHFWRRLGPGRLYDVPSALGWLDRPTEELHMNPVSLFL